MTTLVTGPTRVPLPFGLFSVIPFRIDTADRWLNGVEYETLGDPGQARGISFDEICDRQDDLDLEGSGLELVEAMPFDVYDSYACSIVGNTPEIASEVARARLEANEERYVEQALADGSFGQSPNFQDDALTVELSDSSTPSLAEAVAILENMAGEQYGSQGIFHVSRGTATLMLEEKLAERRGSRLYTMLGTPVVAGSGYAFATLVLSPTFVAYRGEILVPGGYEALLDRETNTLSAIAMRPYVLGLDSLPILEMAFEEALGDTKSLTTP